MKKFIDKKVLDWKFKKAGEGHSLSEEQKQPSNPGPSKQVSRVPSSQSSQTAGAAALARLEGQERKGYSSKGSGLHTGHVMGKERGEKKTCSRLPAEEEARQAEPEFVDIASSSITVHIICPMCQRSVPSHDAPLHLTGCFQKEIQKEPLATSVQMIHTLCHNQEKRTLCIETITRYLDNIKTHPGEEKYWKIRMRNKVFQERVATIEGALAFLHAVGFVEQQLPHQDGEEQFLVLPEEKANNISDLEVCKEILTSAIPLVCKVDRNLQIFKPSFRATHFDLPESFFNLTVEEIRKEQKQKSDKLERESVLRTKAMRERDDMRMAVRHYRFVLLRIRMPDGFFLQGIFRPLEKLQDVRAFISDALVNQSHPFSLSELGKPFLNDNDSLAVLGLVPSAILNFTWDTSLGPTPDPPCLKDELMARIQDL